MLALELSSLQWGNSGGYYIGSFVWLNEKMDGRWLSNAPNKVGILQM